MASLVVEKMPFHCGNDTTLKHIVQPGILCTQQGWSAGGAPAPAPAPAAPRQQQLREGGPRPGLHAQLTQPMTGSSRGTLRAASILSA